MSQPKQCLQKEELGVSQYYGYHFGSHYNKGYSILGSTLGSPYSGKLPTSVGTQHVKEGLLPRIRFLVGRSLAKQALQKVEREPLYQST